MASRRPRLGLTLPRWLSRADLYRPALTRLGAQVLVIGHIPGTLGNPKLGSLDGLVLSGGGDIHPRCFGEALRPCSRDIDEDRDDLEIELTRRAYEARIPVLGVCRGMQVMNVALGGTIYQDLQIDGPKVFRRHKFGRADPKRFHEVRLEEGCWMHRISGQTALTVNSHHHQSIRDVAHAFRVVAHSPDGVIESIEGVEPGPLMIGVQWHPERLGKEHLWPFEAFVEACRPRA